MYQTEPIQGNISGNLWTQGREDLQYSDHNLSSVNGHSQDTLSDSFNPFRMAEDSHSMSRQDSIGAQSARTTHSSGANHYDQPRSVTMYRNASQMSYQMSAIGSDESVRSNSPEYTSTNPLDSQNFNAFSYQGGVHRESSGSMQSHMLTDTSYGTAFASEDAYMAQFISDQAFMSKDSIFSNDSPTLFDEDFLDTQQDPTMLQDDWALPPAQVMSPTAYSPSNDSISSVPYAYESPEAPRLSSRGGKKTGPRQSKVNSDIARNSRPNGPNEILADSLKYTSRNHETDNNARVHELYHNAAPGADGLYHCPWEGKDSCQHKPEKLKCNYEYVSYHNLITPTNRDFPANSLIRISNHTVARFSNVVA